MSNVSIIFKCVFSIVKLGYHVAYSIKVEGLENLPEGAFIIASNHRSYADPPILAITSGCTKFSFMAKEELFKNPVFGCLIRSLGAFPVTRGKGDTNVIDTSIEKLKEGRRLIIFPEGTRSKTGKVGKGKTGASLIAARSGYPVVPVGIVFEGKLHFRSRIIVRYGKPIYPEDFKLSTDVQTRELKEVKRKIMDSITTLVEGEQNGKD